MVILVMFLYMVIFVIKNLLLRCLKTMILITLQTLRLKVMLVDQLQTLKHLLRLMLWTQLISFKEQRRHDMMKLQSFGKMELDIFRSLQMKYMVH